MLSSIPYISVQCTVKNMLYNMLPAKVLLISLEHFLFTAIEGASIHKGNIWVENRKIGENCRRFALTNEAHSYKCLPVE